MNIEKMRRNAQRGRVESPDWKTLDPATKVKIVEAMGFVPRRSEHDRECPREIGGSGYICQCVGEPTEWGAPRDVQEFRGETWEQRVAKRRLAEARSGS